MDINDALQQNIGSLRQAINLSCLKRSMNQDAQSVSALLKGMQSANAKIMENSVTPYKGASIDVRV